MEPFSIEESTTLTGARIVAVGVGGGGGNMIGYMLKEAIPGIELIIANTDAQVLEHGSAATKIQLGAKLTKGLGAGMKPEVGKESALESYEDLSRALEGADIVFVAAGLGGGTGTGAAPIIAKIAKEVGALTIAVVTKPFSFEGKKRLKLAEDGLNELKNESDCIVVIPNDKLLSIIDPKLGIKESFKIVDSVLARAVSGTSGVILASGDNDINLDFADLQTVMVWLLWVLVNTKVKTQPTKQSKTLSSLHCLTTCQLTGLLGFWYTLACTLSFHLWNSLLQWTLSTTVLMKQQTLSSVLLPMKHWQKILSASLSLQPVLRKKRQWESITMNLKTKKW